MTNLSIEVYNHMLFSCDNKYERANIIHEEMKQKGVKMNIKTYNTLLKINKNNFQKVDELYDSLLREKIEFDKNTYVYLLESYHLSIKADRIKMLWETAIAEKSEHINTLTAPLFLHAFYKIGVKHYTAQIQVLYDYCFQHPQLFSFNTYRILIKCFEFNDQKLNNIVDLLCADSTRIVLSEQAFEFLIINCSKQRSIIIKRILNKNTLNDKHLIITIINIYQNYADIVYETYKKVSYFEEKLFILLIKKLQEHKEKLKDVCERAFLHCNKISPHFCAIVINSLAFYNHHDEIFDLIMKFYKKLHYLGRPLSIINYNIFLKASLHKPDIADSIISEMCEFSYVTYNYIFVAYSMDASKYREKMWALFQRAMKYHTILRLACYENLLTVFDNDDAKMVIAYDYAMSTNIKLSPFVCQRFMNVFINDINKVEYVYEKMLQDNTELNNDVLTTLIIAYERRGNVAKMEAFYQKIARKNKFLSSKNYKTIIRAFAPNIDYAHKIYNQYLADHYLPDSEIYEIMIKIYSQSNRYTPICREMQQIMSQRCTALMRGNKNDRAAIHKIYAEMIEKLIPPNDYVFNMVFRIAIRHKELDDFIGLFNSLLDIIFIKQIMTIDELNLSIPGTYTNEYIELVKKDIRKYVMSSTAIMILHARAKALPSRIIVNERLKKCIGEYLTGIKNISFKISKHSIYITPKEEFIYDL